MQQIIVTCLYVLTTLVPLVFTTLNYELFEFPKFLLLITATIIIVVAWGIHMYRTHDTKLFRTPSLVHYSVISVLFTQTLAWAFSIHPSTSFWGYYSRFHQGLLTTICYSVIYFAAVKWLDKNSTQKLIKISISTAFIISLYAILQRLGIDRNLWIQDVVNRPFSTLGQPNWLAAYLIPNLFLVLYLSISQKNKSKTVLVITYCAVFTALLLTKSRSGLIAFVLAYLAYWSLVLRNFNFSKIKQQFLTYSLILIPIALIIGSAYSPSIFSLKSKNYNLDSIPQSGTQLENGGLALRSLDEGGTESGDIRKIVWSGALSLFLEHPLVGTGPETFAYTYYWERPVAHNYVSEWDFLYNKAHNEYLNVASTTGLVGIAGYLFWHLALVRLAITRIKNSKKVDKQAEDTLRAYYPLLLATVVSFTVTNFFGFSVIPVYLMMVITSALTTSDNNKLDEPKYTPTHYSFFVTLCSVFIIIFPIRFFLADYNFALGKKHLDAGSLQSARPYLEKSVSLRPAEPLYHAYLGELYAGLGQTDSALKQAELTQKLNKWHLNFYKSRAKIYLTLATIDPVYNMRAASELEGARKLAPTDPKLAYNLGLVYSRLGDTDKSITQMQGAIELKNNYYEPYYALTLLYEQTGELVLLKELLTQAKASFSPLPEPLESKVQEYL